MLRELLGLFRSSEPLSDMGDSFAKMLRITHEMTVQAGDLYFLIEQSPEMLTQVYERDVQVNKLERSIRKQVIAHLAVRANAPSLPYCLVLMSLVKDVERLGDYAKNLSEVSHIEPRPLPDDEIVAELREIRAAVEAMFGMTAEVFATSDREHAMELIRQGRALASRCEGLFRRIADSEYDARRTTAVVLGARYYKRIAAHLLNILSSVVMPLHKLDYYDEDELDRE